MAVMVQSAFMKEIKQLRPDTKRKFFYWENKIDTSQTKYSELSEEEFKSFANVNDISFYMRWRETEQYQKLLYLYATERFDFDLYEVYIATKEEALRGNSTATKTMIEVQKEMKNRIKAMNTEEVDDGLKLDIK